MRTWNLDISDDKGLVYLSKLGADNKVPEFIKQENMLTGKELEMLNDNDFALVITDKKGDQHRKFPICDRANTWLSVLYYAKNRSDLNPRCRHIAATNLYNALENETERYHQSLSESMKAICEDRKIFDHEVLGNMYKEKAEDRDGDAVRAAVEEVKESRAKLAEDNFALIVQGQGKTFRLFPIDTVENIKKADAYFEKNHRLFPVDKRHEFAARTRDRAKVAGVELESEALQKYASYEWSPNLELAMAIRQKRVSDPVAKEGLSKLAALQGKIEIDKFANMLFKFDVETGLDKGYGKTLPDAFESTYAVKRAYINDRIPGVNSDISYGGHKIKLNDLMRLDVGDLGGLIDSDTLEDLKADPKHVFDSLPLPYKDMIVRALR